MNPAEAKNNVEWNNAANWYGPKWMALYSSKADTRLWVPKRIPSLGWTVNLGHPRGSKWMTIVLSSAVLIVLVSNTLMLFRIFK